MIVHTCFNNRSEHGYKSSILKSGICKYFRRGEKEKFTFCVMEMAYFQNHEKGKGLVTNLINRLKILVMEDLSFHNIGLASYLLTLLDEYDKDRDTSEKLLTFCDMVMDGKRNRLVSYTNCWWRNHETIMDKGVMDKVQKYKMKGDSHELLLLGENLIHFIETKDERMMGIFMKMYKMEESQGVRYRRKDGAYLWFQILEAYMKDDMLKVIFDVAFDMFTRKGMTERFAFGVWIGLILWKRDHLLTEYETKTYSQEQCKEYYTRVKPIQIDEYVVNDYHVNKGFGLGDFAENGAYVKDEYLDLVDNGDQYKAYYILQKKEMDQVKKVKKVKKKTKVIETKVIETKPEPSLHIHILQEIVDTFSGTSFTEQDIVNHFMLQEIVKNFSGKTFTTIDIMNHFKKEKKVTKDNFISWEHFTDMEVIQEGVCGGKFPCIIVNYEDKKYVLKEMGPSMNYGKDYLVADTCKHLFGLRDMNMEIITSDKGLLRKDPAKNSYVDNWDIGKKTATYCMMDYFENMGDIGKHKDRIESSKKEVYKIRLYDGLFRSSDNIMRNILVNKDGDVLSIDEGDLFGKRDKIFNKNEIKKMEGCPEYKSLITDILKEMFENKAETKEYIVNVLTENGFDTTEFSQRFDTYACIVNEELSFE